MKASIITVTFNSQDTIKSTIESVINQTYNNIEYIIIDGGSTDATIDIIKRYESKIAKWISEKDEGIYDALNKGLRFATGDLVGFLHSDDIYENKNIISQIVNVFNKTNNEIVYGDLIYVYKKDVNKIIRYWRAGEYNYERIKKGWIPPHPTFFTRKELYDKYGYFNSNFKIAADYELMLRLLWLHKINAYYIPSVLVKMRIGGTSNKSLNNILLKSIEDYKIIRAYKVGGISTLFYKKISKVPQFFIRP